MSSPDFLVVGAGRSGTTSLHHYLRQHPQVFVPPRKAPSFFYAVDAPEATDPLRRLETRATFVRDEDAYRALFEGAEGARAVGEVSPAYLAALRVPDRIARSLPDARIIAILRNPIDRVVSRYVARRRDGLEQAIDLETVVEREGRPWAPIEDAAGTYVAAGFVSHVLERYLELFPREQVRLYLYEELASDAASLLRDLFAFLGVDPDLPIDVSAVHNRSGGEISAPLRRLLWTRTAALRTRIRPYLQGAARDRAFAIVARDRRSVAIPASLYSQFISIYGDEVRKLEQILDRDLSHWLRPSTDQG